MQKVYRDKNGKFCSKHLAVVKPKRTGKIKKLHKKDIGSLNLFHKPIPKYTSKHITINRKVKIKKGYTSTIIDTLSKQPPVSHKIYTDNEMDSIIDNLLLNKQLDYTKRRNIEKLQLNLYIRRQYGSSVTRALRIKELSKRVFNDTRAMNKEDIDILQKNNKNG